MVGAEARGRRAGLLAGDSLFQPRDLDRLIKPLICSMHAGPELSRYDDVMLCALGCAMQPGGGAVVMAVVVVESDEVREEVRESKVCK